MKIHLAVSRAAGKLAAEKIINPTIEAQLILGFVLDESRECLIAHDGMELTGKQSAKFRRLINRRLKHEPLAYLCGRKSFYGLQFNVDRRVLIPRPETELLVETLLSCARTIGRKKIIIADIGTGSGCIAIALKKLLPAAEIIASDVSPAALAVAAKNAALNKVEIKFVKSDLLEKMKNAEIDIIAANLPYLRNDSAQNRDTGFSQALKFEPSAALFGGSSGLEHYERLFTQIKALAYRPKFVFCEIGQDQGRPILSLAKKYLPDSKPQVKKDLSGFDRLLIIEIK